MAEVVAACVGAEPLETDAEKRPACVDVSAAGGAFLEWMEGKPLPGVEVLRIRQV